MNGLVNRTGAWYQLDDGTKVQGREAFIEKVREDEALQKKLVEQLNA
jgi:hypothetical protein